MNKSDTKPAPTAAEAATRRAEAATRALDEARQRRAAIDASSAERPLEKNGRGGLEPVRYGDWEVKGLTSDF